MTDRTARISATSNEARPMPLKWTEAYGCYTARVGKIGSLAVTWSSKGYVVKAFDVSLKEPSADVEDGKRRAVALAQRLLAEAAAAFEPETV
jgi:hypothetical protein